MLKSDEILWCNNIIAQINSMNEDYYVLKFFHKLRKINTELHEITKEIPQESTVIDVQATNTPNTITTISEPKNVSNEPVLAKLGELKEGSKEWWDALSK